MQSLDVVYTKWTVHISVLLFYVLEYCGRSGWTSASRESSGENGFNLNIASVLRSLNSLWTNCYFAAANKQLRIASAFIWRSYVFNGRREDHEHTRNKKRDHIKRVQLKHWRLPESRRLEALKRISILLFNYVYNVPVWCKCIYKGRNLCDYGYSQN